MKVFIVGMHRSGTSMVTGLLGMCGLYLGDNLKRPMRENPKGFFEDNEFVNINKEILRQSGGRWDVPPAEIKVDGALRGRMKAFVDKWPRDRAVGFKDPRTCLTLREWIRVADDDEIRLVNVSRHRSEIANSLKKRNGVDLDFAEELINHYLFCVAAHALNLIEIGHVVETHYSRYFVDWESELKRVCDFLRLKIPADTSAIEAFIEPKLRHHKAA